MTAKPLAGRAALVLGVERAAGRAAAIALGEAGASVALCTLSRETAAKFAANSAANEFWAFGGKTVVVETDGDEASISEAIGSATAQLGAVSVLVWHAATPGVRDALAGLRSDPAIVVLVGDDDALEAAPALLAWTRELADAGLRANAVVGSRGVLDVAGPVLKEHHAAEAADLASAVVYLASDASAAVEGAVVVVAGSGPT
ncbi:MAG: SDR family NAD(P)-dependent oxidoreductase [Dehalococcoidia bacterium]